STALMRFVVLALLTLYVPPDHLRQGSGGPPELYAKGGSYKTAEAAGGDAKGQRGEAARAIRAQTDLRLWYRQPAANWNEALPIGNGRLGAMVFGGVATEHLQLNEDTVWAGEKRDRMNPAGPAAVKEVRRLLAEGKAAEAEALADKAIIASPRRMPPYQPLGDLRLRFAASGAATGYQRDLDLTNAIARVNYTIERTTYIRETLSS